MSFNDLTSEIPSEAVDVYESKPDIRTEYSTVSAQDQGYDNRSGDLATLIESAASNNQLVDLGDGTYEMSSTVSVNSGIVGVVGDGATSATIYYSGTSLELLFSINGASEVVLEGVTFDITEDPGDGTDTDVGLMTAEITNECWCEDITFRGQRHRNQDLNNDGNYTTVGSRFTFLIEMTQTDGTALLHRCRFPDGGTDEHQNIGSTTGHAIGPNADPDHHGLNVWKECRAEGFKDNGFYVNNSPGRNVLWDCTAINNCAGSIRLGNNDYVVGGYSEVSSTPDGRLGKPLEANSGANIHVVGLELYGSGDAFGNEIIQLRDENLDSITLDRVVAHCETDGENRVARLSGDVANIELIDCYWYDESTSSRTAVNIFDADVTATNLHLLSENNDEILLQSSGSLTLDGQSISSGTYSASELSLSDPRPLPEFNFYESGEYIWQDKPNPNPWANQVKYSSIGPHPIDIEYQGYPRRPRESGADEVVTTTSELYTAISNASGGDLIWLDEDSDFDITNRSRNTVIPQGVTLASNGARILATEAFDGVFRLSNSNIRITGIRFEGHQAGYHDADEHSTALRLEAQDIRIDNCEFYGWVWSSIYTGWNEHIPETHIEPQIHHNIIRDCKQTGSGYGIIVVSGDPLIEYNFFNNNRQSIAGGGRDSCSYRAINNLHGEETLDIQFEMHLSGGDRVIVENNEFMATEKDT